MPRGRVKSRARAGPSLASGHGGRLACAVRPALLCAVLLVACEGTLIGSGGTGGGSIGGTGGGASSEPGDGGDTSSSACRVVSLLQSRCISCHTNPPMNAAPMVLDSLDALRAPSLKVSGETNAQRSIVRLRDAAAPMPPPPERPGTGDEAALLETWVQAGMPDCASPPDGGTDGGAVTPVLEEPNLIPQGELFTCTPGTKSNAPTRVRRLNRWSWTRNVGGPVTRSWTGFSFFDNPFDPSAFEPYGTYATDESVDESMIEITLPIVQAYGETWAGPYTGGNRLELLRLDTTLRCMWQDDAPSQACIRNYGRVLLERGVLYRPPRADELDRLVTFANAVLAQESADAGQDGRTHSLVRIVTAAMMTTGALFREELGAPTDAGRVQLADWELAGQLTYAIGARGPGAVPTWRFPNFSAPIDGHYADVAGAARDGGIRQAAVVDALVRRHFGGTDAMRLDLLQDFGDGDRLRRGEYWLGDGVLTFFREWLGYTRVDSIFKERPEGTSRFDDGDPSGYRAQLSAWGNLMDGYYGEESTLIQQMDDMVARAVVPDTQVLRTLLTTRTFFLAATQNSGFDGNATRYTGQPYGTDAVISNTNAERWRTLPMSERAGVLTHPAWLASHGGNFEDDPSAVHRGKWVREMLLCGYVPPLSQVRVVAQVGPHAADKNARRRLEDATGKAECQGCHGLMNPLGLPFETYNHAGYLRERDHAVDGGWAMPDGTSSLAGMPDPTLNGPVRDAVELSEKLSVSPHVKRCFLRHTFRYFMGRNENRSDACTLAAMEQAYDSNGGSFKAALSALMTSETWTERTQ
ncbi:MAG: DUF1588 domain-containing protein [Myxococcaceae bacterium]|nr:DUF1588 domain-containing protein [Myxococcaceae bacterium]